MQLDGRRCPVSAHTPNTPSYTRNAQSRRRRRHTILLLYNTPMMMFNFFFPQLMYQVRSSPSSTHDFYFLFQQSAQVRFRAALTPTWCLRFVHSIHTSRAHYKIMKKMPKKEKNRLVPNPGYNNTFVGLVTDGEGSQREFVLSEIKSALK